MEMEQDFARVAEPSEAYASCVEEGSRLIEGRGASTPRSGKLVARKTRQRQRTRSREFAAEQSGVWPILGGEALRMNASRYYLDLGNRRYNGRNERIRLYECTATRRISKLIGRQVCLVTKELETLLSGQQEFIRETRDGLYPMHALERGEGKRCAEPGWDDWSQLNLKPRPAIVSGNPVKVTSDAIEFELPLGLRADAFEEWYRAALAPMALAHWATSDKGAKHCIDVLGTSIEGLQRSTAIDGNAARVRRERQLVLFDARTDPSRLARMIEERFLEFFSEPQAYLKIERAREKLRRAQEQ